jgi:signal peptidase I
MRSRFLCVLIAATAVGSADNVSAAFTFAGYTCCYTLSAGSMLPTLEPNAYMAVVKYFDDDLPKAGDVVIFRLPRDSSTLYVKRVVGLPGDSVQMLKGELHVRGAVIKRELVGDYPGEKEAPPAKRWKETLPNGVSYETLDLTEAGFADNTKVYTVPPRHYFVLGDNRDNSMDSRFPEIGYIPVENIVGQIIRPWSHLF